MLHIIVSKSSCICQASSYTVFETRRLDSVCCRRLSYKPDYQRWSRFNLAMTVYVYFIDIFMILISSYGLSLREFVLTWLIFCTTSIPLATRPNTVCLLSSHGCSKKKRSSNSTTKVLHGQSESSTDNKYSKPPPPLYFHNANLILDFLLATN